MNDKIRKYCELTNKWSKRYNLLGVGLEFDHMVEHSKALWSIANPARNNIVIDIGSGVGFPGIVWAIESELNQLNIQIHLVERRETACTFLRYCKHALTLPNLHIHQTDIRKFNLKDVDIITAQAFSSLLQTAQYSQHLWNEKTYGVFLKTSDPSKEIYDLESEFAFLIEKHPYNHGTLIKISDLKQQSQI